MIRLKSKTLHSTQKPVSTTPQPLGIEIASEKCGSAQSEPGKGPGDNNQIPEDVEAVGNDIEKQTVPNILPTEEEVEGKKYLSGIPFVILTLALMATTFVAGLDQNIICGFLAL